MGVIIDASQRASIDKYIQQAKEEAAEVFQVCATIPNMVKGSFIHQHSSPVLLCAAGGHARSLHYLTGFFSIDLWQVLVRSRGISGMCYYSLSGKGLFYPPTLITKVQPVSTVCRRRSG